MDSLKVRFDRAIAIKAAKIVVDAIKPACVQLIVAGSLRRRKLRVSDVELLFVPKVISERDGLFDSKEVSMVDRALDTLIQVGVIEKRKNASGYETWGPKIKLARECSTGVPIDFFQTTLAAWHNYLVVRTGPSQMNIQIAKLAKLKGLEWKAFGCGFEDRSGVLLPVNSERDVFRTVGLPYKEPWER